MYEKAEDLSSARALPLELVASQVDALFSDIRSFLIGSAGACVAILTVGVRTHSRLLMLVAGLLVALTIIRAVSMRAYFRQRSSSRSLKSLRQWEHAYHLGAAAHIVVISLFCLVTFVVTDGALERLLSAATVLTYMTGIPGRNFANALGVDAQIIGGGLPLLLSMGIAGGGYWLIAVIVFLPFFMALRGLSSRLRGIFIQATIKAHEFGLLAARFDTALSNMSHGLAMFDRAGHLMVYNQRLLQLLHLEPKERYVGKHSSSIFAQLAIGDVTEDHRVAQLQAHIKEPPLEPFEIEMLNGVSLEITFQSMQDGGVVVLVQEITERKRAEERINQLALYDELTGIANRSHLKTLLETRLGRAPGNEKYALLFIDLDQFKQVNDTLGHSGGDLLIRQVANRLRIHLDDRSVIARFGGDEFVVLLRLDEQAEQVEIAASNMISRISEPYRLDGHDVVIGASIGIAIFPKDDTEPDQLLKKADTALYRAKADGRGTFRFFEPCMDIQARARSELEFDLRQALRNREFEVFFQPIFNIKTGHFTVCEALLRWRHPIRGLVSPAEFIPVAEEMGLIVPIGNWVLERACLECATWPNQVGVAVNLSPLQFRRGDIVATVSAALHNAQLAPERLELELTESVLLQDVTFTAFTMNLLNEQRVRISLDDFGTGYSSLSYLHKLPLNKVKIDRSFLAGLGTNRKTALLIGSLTRLIADLGLSLVIEGVETDEQLRLVTDAADIDEVQGYLFSHPLPADKIRALLLREAPRARKRLPKVKIA